MLKIINGNIFDGNEDIICHQTNCLGIMGGGIALQVKKLYPNVYNEYSNLCKDYKENLSHLLGYTQFVKTPDDRIIANCFGQLGIGATVQTHYMALAMSLASVYRKAIQENLSVAIPYNIGCGLAGGDWNVVYEIISKLFKNTDINCVLYKFQG